MFRWMSLLGLLISSTAAAVIAQAPGRPTDPVFARAQALVSDGNGAAGRALIDSVIRATPPIAPLYPQALFWRASLAASAADAESDYKHIVVDYPLAPQAADALLRLAQLELARGDRDGALAHLQRIPRDYPHSKSLARANYWTARVLFEKNDIARACAANTSALALTDTTEIELRNQIQYQGQRCPSPGAPVSTASDTPPSNALPTMAAPPVKESAASATVPAEKPAAKATSGGSPTRYSVQVAAYTRKAEADKLVAALKARGYEAKVDGSAAPFRVKIGHYLTAKDAEQALQRIKAKHMDGFVARAAER